MKYLKKFITVVIIVVIIIPISISTSYSQVFEDDEKDFKVYTNQVIVKYADTLSVSKEAIRMTYGITSYYPLPLDETEVWVIDGGFKHKIAFSFPSYVEEAVYRLNLSSNIVFAQPDYLYYPAATVSEEEISSGQWNIWNETDTDMDIVEGWKFSQGEDVVIAVLDTGVDINHPDIRENIWVNSNEISDDGLDNDNNGFVDDINGWDFFNDDNSVSDSNVDDMHGTIVAGIIGAVKDNGIGIVGVAPRAEILPLKVIGSEGGKTSDIIRAIEYCNDLKEQGVNIKIANCSWQGFAKEEDIFLKNAIEESELLFINSAGNSGQNLDADNDNLSGIRLDNLIRVTGTQENGNLASYANYGEQQVDFGAPSDNIWSISSTEQYVTSNGTSMAAANLSGLFTLIYSYNHDMSVAEAVYIVSSSLKPSDTIMNKVKYAGAPSVINALRSLDINAPTIPQEVYADPSDTGINISWHDVDDVDLKGYNIYRSINMEEEYYKIAETEASNYLDREINEGNLYRYKVSSVDGAGNESALSECVEVILEVVDEGVSVEEGIDIEEGVGFEEEIDNEEEGKGVDEAIDVEKEADVEETKVVEKKETRRERKVVSKNLAGYPVLAAQDSSGNKIEFADVRLDYWANKEITELVNRGVIIEEGPEFWPEKEITRAEVAQMIFMFISDKQEFSLNGEVLESDFMDVKDKVSEIAIIARLGIMKGYNEAVFGSDNGITKEELIVVIMRVLAQYNLEIPEKHISLNDIDKMTFFAKDSIDKAIRLGIVIGNLDGELEPKKLLNKAEATVMLKRMIDKIEQK